MARKRKDTYCGTGEWAKHLKPYGKRVMAKAERREAVRTIAKTIQDNYPEGVCTDCGWKIRSDVTHGAECRNCGHVFYAIQPIVHGDDPRCICRPCPADRDDMFWREDEELQCEAKARGKGLIC